MCGITGFVDFQRISGEGDQVLAAMTSSLALRGPDANGVWRDDYAAIGHTRLAIIDLRGGVQPMVAEVTPQRKVVLTFSGEIYNFVELRAELRARGHEFRTQSDTEVVLRGYLEWGAKCVDRFLGMFAFAIWDSGTQELLLARDRIGVKPLFYYLTPHGVVFGSELKALLAHPAVDARIDTSGIAELFAMAPNTSPGTAILRDIVDMHPGTVVTVRRSGVHTHRYWTLSPKVHEDDEATTIQRLRELLEESVASQSYADVPIASLLSGGVDSSIIAALAAAEQRRHGRRLTTFAIDYRAEDGGVEYGSSSLHVDRDTPFAEAVAAHIDSDHITHYVGVEEMIQAHERALVAMDLPSFSPLTTSLLLLFERVKHDATVALSGESADEWFGGYAWYHQPQDPATVFPWQLGYRPLHHLLREDVAATVQPEKYLSDRSHELLDSVPYLDSDAADQRRSRQTFWITAQHYLRWLLHRKDRMSMAAGVEARVPFCDHRLVEYAWSIPWSMQGYRGMEKGLLRAAGEHLLPPSVAWRKKSGYPAALFPAYRDWLWRRMRDLAADSAAPLWQLVDQNAVTSMLERDTSLADWTTLMHVSYLLEVATWLRTYRVSMVE